MRLKAKGRAGGVVAVLALVVAILIVTAGIWTIRIGGPLDKSVQGVNDLTADILPPPSYVIEPYLEATLLVDRPASLAERRARLAVLEKGFRSRLAYWQASDLDAGLKAQLLEQVGASGDAFWRELDDHLLPAAQAHDDAAMRASYARLSDIYAGHRRAVDVLVADTAHAGQSVLAHADNVVIATMALLAIAALALVGLIAFGLRHLMSAAIVPLAETAEVMTAMARGNLDAGRTTQHRIDEIGDMTRAIEVFRDVSMNQREAQARQHQVVELLSASLQEMAEGNLGQRIDQHFASEYESLRGTYNTTLELLADLIFTVASAADGVSSGSAEIRAASDDLAMRNERQASFVEEIAGALAQLVQNVRETTEGTIEVRSSISDAHDVAEKSRHVVSRAVAAMAEIEASSSQITQIIDVIDGISFQTNLLALNAGVEAARAGEAGKGFAVVATEVRALAQRSADAASDIKRLISASTRHVEEGVGLVGETGEQLRAIVERVAGVNQRIAGITDAAEQQRGGIEKIHGLIGELDRMTQQNAAMVEESTAAARSLSTQSGELADLCGRFSTGRSRSAANDPAPAVRAAPPVIGNLALKVEPASEDWSEF